MSTRAIIGILSDPVDDFKGAWQWNDGGTPLPLLKKHFNTEEDIQKLIEIGHYGCLMSQDDARDFLDWLVKAGHEENEARKHFIDVLGNKKVYAYLSYEGQNKPAETFHGLKDALAQDINYVYIFNPLNGTWAEFS